MQHYLYISSKGADRHDAKNYRPITITSLLCRLLEKILKQKICQHFTENNTIPSEQHGFMKNKSCLTNLLETLEDITKWQDMGIPVDEIYLDFSKAFDKVPHQRLIYKLEKLGITGSLLTWIESFLFQRKQRVKIKGSLSEESHVKSGVPQGSVLGPLLFIAYINDLPLLVNSPTKVFADDTKMYKEIESISDADSFQADIDSLVKWCQEWGMKFNISKCYIMHYGKNNNNYLYHIQGHLLATCSTYKDLGVIVSNDLKPAEQIAKCVAKANQMVGMIRRTFSYIDKEIFLRTYKVFVRPILEYCQQSWAPYLVKDIEEIEKVQQRAAKLVPELRDMPYIHISDAIYTYF